MVDRVSLKGFIQLDQIEDLLSDLNSRLRFLETNLSTYQTDKENDEISLKVLNIYIRLVAHSLTRSFSQEFNLFVARNIVGSTGQASIG